MARQWRAAVPAYRSPTSIPTCRSPTSGSIGRPAWLHADLHWLTWPASGAPPFPPTAPPPPFLPAAPPLVRRQVGQAPLPPGRPLLSPCSACRSTGSAAGSGVSAALIWTRLFGVRLVKLLYRLDALCSRPAVHAAQLGPPQARVHSSNVRGFAHLPIERAGQVMPPLRTSPPPGGTTKSTTTTSCASIPATCADLPICRSSVQAR